MKALLRSALAVAAVAIATQAVAQVTFYEREGFEGRTFTTGRQIGNLERQGFNDRASSVEVAGDRWEVCEDVRFSGRCVVLRPGRYPSLAAMGLNDRISSVRSVARNARVDDQRYAPAPVAAQVTLYERENFGGRSFTTDRPVENFKRNGFNDRASSVDVVGEPWEVCQDIRFSGRCVVLRPGRYPSLAAMGLNDRISSVRSVARNARIDDQRYAPAPVAAPDYRRRNDERLYEANVTSVRAVVGTPEQRCWVEREQIPQDRSNANVPGAIVGGIIGGILGHQVGGGTGKDLATVGGVVAGAAVGANIGNGQQTSTQDVQRCQSVPSQARPEYWDVTYNFRGQEHRIQMTAPPGPTVTVNEQGEPRK
ncbi:MAG: glycine zipper 2TM domain-containing protein [Polaromonas sp.]|nr:glycine zipper 2TM domain-containing protein [Polaromonas sp.]